MEKLARKCGERIALSLLIRRTMNEVYKNSRAEGVMAILSQMLCNLADQVSWVY